MSGKQLRQKNARVTKLLKMAERANARAHCSWGKQFRLDYPGTEHRFSGSIMKESSAEELIVDFGSSLDPSIWHFGRGERRMAARQRRLCRKIAITGGDSSLSVVSVANGKDMLF